MSGQHGQSNPGEAESGVSHQSNYPPRSQAEQIGYSRSRIEYCCISSTSGIVLPLRLQPLCQVLCSERALDIIERMFD